MKARITIEMNGTAFNPGPHQELARILHDLANKIRHGALMQLPLLDSNGNKVGTFEIKERPFGRRSVQSRFPKAGI
jgi:hypothetical protein